MLRLGLLLVLVACNSNHSGDKGPPPPPPAKPEPLPPPPPVTGPTAGFDRTCTAATDCVIVKPASCDPCGCPTDAISSKAMAAFDEAQNKLDCPTPDLKVNCMPCAPKIAACAFGACAAAPLPPPR